MKVKIIPRTFQYLALMLLTFFSLGPLLLLVINAVKPADQFVKNPIGLPTSLSFMNLVTAWNQGNYGRAFLNSIFVSGVTIVVVDICVACCAYSLAKLHPKFGGAVMNYFLVSITVPTSLCLVPLFFMWQKLHLMNTLLGLILIYCGSNIAFNVIFTRAFFLGIPGEVLESARLDGCDEFNTVWRIVAPMSKPAFFTISLLTGLGTWNEFFYANTFIQTDSLRTVATRYIAFVGHYSSNWSEICAAGLITVIPMVILYLCFQRSFIEGLTSGSVKM